MDIEKSTFNDFVQNWLALTHNQQRFATAMLSCKTKKEAAELIGIRPNTTYTWNGAIDDVLEYMRNDAALAALGIIRANATRAAMVKSSGLDSRTEQIRQSAATEILDRNLGKPTQRQEVTGPAGGAIQIKRIVENRDAGHADD